MIPANDQFVQVPTSGFVYGYSNWGIGSIANVLGFDDVTPGFMHSGYGGAAFASATGLAINDTRVVAATRKETWPNDVIVQGAFQQLSLQGGFAPQIFTHGLTARMQNPTGEQLPDTFNWRMTDADGYAMLIYMPSTTVIRLRLVRFVAGNPFTLGTFDIPNTSSALLYTVQVFGLRVFDEGVNTRVIATLNGTEFVSVLDTSGSQIKGAGGCGFFAQSEQFNGSSATICQCQQFSISDIDEDVLFLDDFTRAFTIGAEITDGYGVSGRSLRCDYSYDLFSQTKEFFDLTQDGRNALRSDSIDSNESAVGEVGPTSDLEIWATRVHEASNIRNQRRIIEVEHAFHSIETGITLRISQNPSSPKPEFCYLAKVMTTLLDGQEVTILRIDDASETIIAKKITADTIPLDSTFTFEFEIRQADAPNVDAWADLIVKLNGTPVDWSAVDTAAANPDLDPNLHLIIASGQVRDLSAFKIVSGIGEGLFIGGGTLVLGGRKAYVQSFVEGTLFVPSFQDEGSIETLSLDYEADGSFGTLVLEASYPFFVIDRMPKSEVTLRSGKKQRLSLSLLTRSSWRVSYRGMKRSEHIEYLEQFFTDHKGNSLGFTWTPPGEFEIAGKYKLRDHEILWGRQGGTEASGVDDMTFAFDLIFDPVFENNLA